MFWLLSILPENFSSMHQEVYELLIVESSNQTLWLCSQCIGLSVAACGWQCPILCSI